MNASTKLLMLLLERGNYEEAWTKRELLKLLPIVERANSAVIGKIAEADKFTRDWLADFKGDVDAAYAAMSADIKGKLLGDFRVLMGDELKNMNDTFGNVLGGLPYSSPSADKIWATLAAMPTEGGRTITQYIEALGASGSTAVIDAVQRGMVEGLNNQQMVQLVRGKVEKRASWRTGPDGKKYYVPGQYSEGAMDATTRGAEALVRTMTNFVANETRQQFLGENEDLIKGYQRVETLDGDTCLECGADDGTVYDVDEPRPELPAHINCRGTYVPVLKSFKDMGFDVEDYPAGTRSSLDGQIPQYETYADRLAKMSPEKQNAMIGPGRAELFRAGMPLKDMIGDDRKVIPLADLKK